MLQVIRVATVRKIWATQSDVGYHVKVDLSRRSNLHFCISETELSRNASDVLLESYDIERVLIPPMVEEMDTPSKKFKSELFLDSYGSLLTGLFFSNVFNLTI